MYIVIDSKEKLKKLITSYRLNAKKERASYCTPLFQKKMKEETEKLTYFENFERMIKSGCTVNELLKEVKKAHKEASKHRDTSKNSGMTCVPPVVLSSLILFLSKDIENLMLIKSKNDGRDLLELVRLFP